MKEKSHVNDIDRSIYDIRDVRKMLSDWKRVLQRIS